MHRYIYLFFCDLILRLGCGRALIPRVITTLPLIASPLNCLGQFFCQRIRLFRYIIPEFSNLLLLPATFCNQLLVLCIQVLVILVQSFKVIGLLFQLLVVRSSLSFCCRRSSFSRSISPSAICAIFLSLATFFLFLATIYLFSPLTGGWLSESFRGFLLFSLFLLYCLLLLPFSSL